MQWFQIKEHSAGEKRLLLSYYLYKVLGKNFLYIIAFFVAFFTFILVPEIRNYSKKYFTVIEPYTGLKPSWLNRFKHVYSYARSLVDKMLVYCGDFNPEDVVFESVEDKTLLYEDMAKNKGVFFICNHIGNIEVLQSLFFNTVVNPDFYINVFLSNKQSQIFNGFLNKIKWEIPVRLFFVEDIGLNTGIELKESLDNGNVVFIAGDRLSENNDVKHIATELFSHKIFLPEGSFKLAKLMDVPTYFISVLKVGKYYKIYSQKENIYSEKELVKLYAQYLKKIILIDPFQFYNFYDFFREPDVEIQKR